jgi:hypothetical protein
VPGFIYWNLGMGHNKGEVLGDDEAMWNIAFGTFFPLTF